MKQKQIQLEFRRHELTRDLKTERLVCSLCTWAWKTPPVSECPGVPRYAYERIPPELAHRTALRARHLRPGGPPRGVYFRSGQGNKSTRWCALYRVAEAVPAGRKAAAETA